MIRMIDWGCSSFISLQKIIKYFPVVFICCTSLFYSLPLIASDYFSSKSFFYSGARLGYSYNHNSCADMAIRCDREDAGYGVFGGYEFNSRIAWELSVTELGDTKVVYPNINLIGELFTVDLSLKYAHVLRQDKRVFAKLGAAYWDGEVMGWNTTLNDSGVRPAAGVGIEFPLFEQVEGRLEYHYFDQLGNQLMGYTDANLISFSLVWKFSTENSGL